MRVSAIFLLGVMIFVSSAQEFNYDGLRENRYMLDLKNYTMHLIGKEKLLQQFEAPNLITILNNVNVPGGECGMALAKLFNITDLTPQNILKLLGEPGGKG